MVLRHHRPYKRSPKHGFCVCRLHIPQDPWPLLNVQEKCKATWVDSKQIHFLSKLVYKSQSDAQRGSRRGMGDVTLMPQNTDFFFFLYGPLSRQIEFHLPASKQGHCGSSFRVWYFCKLIKSQTSQDRHSIVYHNSHSKNPENSFRGSARLRVHFLCPFCI